MSSHVLLVTVPDILSLNFCEIQRRHLLRKGFTKDHLVVASDEKLNKCKPDGVKHYHKRFIMLIARLLILLLASFNVRCSQTYNSVMLFKISVVVE